MVALASVPLPRIDEYAAPFIIAVGVCVRSISQLGTVALKRVRQSIRALAGSVQESMCLALDVGRRHGFGWLLTGHLFCVSSR